MGERRGTKALELWCRRMVDGYPGVKIDNMTTSWRDGLAFCAIIHHFRPDLIDFAKLTKGDIYYNNDLAFTVAEKHLGIPALLEPEDMVEYEVPDRLSILTYLAQFYRAFVTPQGSTPSRIVPKRPATTPDRGIVSPASTSPPTKMVNRSGGVPRRDPCAKCGLPVFIAERLNVGKLLYHRTCFRCARCNSQLTLANYYETDSNEFCCETCPDEESPTKTTKPQPSFLDKPLVLSRSLSDEEKSASLKKKDSDDYSAVFESALENTDDPTLKKDSTLTKEVTQARSAFLTTQVVSSSESDEEMPPELPKTKPPDISGTIISDSVNSLNKTETSVEDSVVYRTKVSDQLNAASTASSSPVKSVTKDNALESRPTSVKDRMKHFEKAQSPVHSTRSSTRTETNDKPPSPVKVKEAIRSSPIREKSDNRFSPIRTKPHNVSPQLTKSKSSSPVKERLSETVIDSKPSPIRRASDSTSLGSCTTSIKSSTTRGRPESLSIQARSVSDSIKSPVRTSPVKTREDPRISTPTTPPRKYSVELPKVSELRSKFPSPVEQMPQETSSSTINKPSTSTTTPKNLNSLLEKQIGLKKSKTTPLVAKEKDQEPLRRPFSDISIRSSSNPQIQLPRRFENTQDLAKTDVSALDNLVDVGVVEEASKLVDDTKCTDDDNVSEKLVAENDCQVLGDGNIAEEEVHSDVDNKLAIPEDRSDSCITVDMSSVSKEPVELLHSPSKEDVSMKIEEVINISDSTEEIIETPKTINDSAITIEDSVIEISDDSNLDQSRNEEEYPEDLNPFGDDEEVDKADQNTMKSSNPFDDEEEQLEPVPAKPVPAVRRKAKSAEQKPEGNLNPFDDDNDEEPKPQEKPKPTSRTKIMVSRIPASEDDTPEFIKTKNLKSQRISVNPSENGKDKNANTSTMKLIPAPRISLNPFWSDADEDGLDDEDEGGLPKPNPRKTRISTDTPEKQKNHQGLSAFGSSSSLSSVNSGVQSVRKKKPAPRPPILSPDRQDSAHSSLTSSPNASAQHSPRLSATKNRKTKRAPPPPSSTPNTTAQSITSLGLTPIQNDGTEEDDWEKQKEAKDEKNRNRQSQTFAHSDSDVSGNTQPTDYIPDKSTFGKWKRKKGPAPSRPVPQRRSIKQLPMTEIKKELDLIELQQQGLEKQGVRLEQIIRERCEGPNVNLEEVEPIDVDDLILQLFEVVNEKNELCRRQAELMYLRRQQRLEEEHAEVEYEIRCLMMQPEANKTDTDKAREEKLISRLVDIVERRNEIIECLEMDRVRENDEDTSITNSLNTYASKREEPPVTPEPEDLDKMQKKKKKKKIKLKFIKKGDLDKDIDESETSSVSSGKEKKKKKFALF